MATSDYGFDINKVSFGTFLETNWGEILRIVFYDFPYVNVEVYENGEPTGKIHRDIHLGIYAKDARIIDGPVK